MAHRLSDIPICRAYIEIKKLSDSDYLSQSMMMTHLIVKNTLVRSLNPMVSGLKH
jgi:hypothetical protein